MLIQLIIAESIIAKSGKTWVILPTSIIIIKAIKWINFFNIEKIVILPKINDSRIYYF